MTRMMSSRRSRGKRAAKIGRRDPIRRRKPDQKGTPLTTRATQDQETMPTETASIASTASYRNTHKKSVSNESETRNCVKTDRAVPIGPECI